MATPQLRAIPDTLSPDVVARIDATLRDVELEHSVKIPWAIESGSRAWGFPSPDSDYDCRFIYVRSAKRYMSLWPDRDVIETPLDRELDINGWDLAKALKLMLKGNAVVIEWLQSPIIYQGDARFRDDFLALARRFSSRTLIARHYLHLGERQRRVYLADDESVPLKKLFYVLRPAAALRWLRLHPEQAIAPMDFPTLMAECAPPAAVTETIGELLLRKSKTRELGMAPIPAPISDFIVREFGQSQSEFAGGMVQLPETAQAETDAFFLKTVKELI